MKVCGIVALLLFASGCATTRIVKLDTGRGMPIVYTPVESEQVEIDDEEFKSAVMQLVLDMKLSVSLEGDEQENHRSLLAAAGGVVDGAG